MMKLKSVFLVAVLMVSSAVLFAQEAEKKGITTALNAGNSAALGSYFANSVDLAIPGSEEVYSKDQARIIVDKFFSENQPKSFEVKHEGKSKLQDLFYIGDLVTQKGAYRLTFFLKKEGEGFKIKQLRIEEG